MHPGDYGAPEEVRREHSGRGVPSIPGVHCQWRSRLAGQGVCIGGGGGGGEGAGSGVWGTGEGGSVTYLLFIDCIIIITIISRVPPERKRRIVVIITLRLSLKMMLVG